MALTGGGVNLGAATIYLLVDGSDARRNLQRASRDYENYLVRKEKADAAAAKTTASRAAQRAATAQAGQVTDPKFIDSERKLAAQVAATNDVIAKSYRIRTAAVAAAAKAQSEASGRIDAALAAEKKATDLVAASKANLAKVNAQLASRVTNPATGRQIQEFQGAARKKLLTDQIALTGLLANAENVEAAAQAEVTRERGRSARVASASGKAILAANEAQIKSTNALASSVATQGALYRDIGNTAGGSFVSLGRNAERTAQTVVQSITRMRDAHEQLARAQAALATNPANKSLVRAFETAQVAAVATSQQFIKADAERLASNNKLTSRLIGNQVKATEATLTAAAQEQAALRAVAEARERQITSQLGQIGHLAGRAFAVGAIGVGVATAQFVGLEKEMINVGAISQEIDVDIESFTEKVQDLAVELGKSPTELAEGLYEIAQAGFEGAEAFGILEVASRAAVAGQTSVEQAAKPLIGVMNAYGVSVEDAQAAMDVMFSGVQEGIFSFEELSSQLGDNISIAQTLGVSLEELMAIYITLTRRSNSLSESTTQVNAVMSSFLKPSEALTAAVKEMTGETATMFFRSHDLAEVLALVNRMFDENADAAGKLFPNIRAIRGIYGLTANEAGVYAEQLEVVSHASDGVGATAQVLNRQMESTAFQLSQAKEQMRLVAIIAGKSFAPGVLAGAQAIGSLAQGFNDLDPRVQSTISNLFLGVTAMTGFILVGTKIITTIIGIADSLKRLKQFLGETRTAFLGWGAVFSAVAIAAFAIYQKIQADNAKTAASYDAVTDAIARVQDIQLRGQLFDLRIDTTEQLGGLIATVDKFADAKKKLQSDLAADSSVFGLNLDLREQDWLTNWELTRDEINTVNDSLNSTTTLLGDNVEQLRVYEGISRNLEELYKGGLEGDQFARAQKDITDALKRTNSEAERSIVLQKFADIFTEFANIKAEFGPGKAMEFLNTELTFAESSEFGIAVAQQAKDATEAIEGTADAVSTFSEAGEKTTDEFLESLKAITDQALTLSGALVDISDPLAFLRQQFDNQDLTLPQAILDMQRTGLTIPGIDESIQSALEIVSAMDHWAVKMDEVTEKMSATSEESAKWAGISQTVADAIGTEADAYSTLNRLVATNMLTQKQADEIRQAGIFLTNQATISTEELAAEQALALVDLAEFVSLYEGQKQAYDDLSPAQRGRIEALQDERNQTMLLTLMMLRLLEAMDLVDDFTTANLVKEIAAADPEFAALAKSVGLVPTDIDITATVDTEGATRSLQDIRTDISLTKERLNSALKLEASLPEADRGAFKQQIGELNQELDGLVEEERVAEIELRSTGVDPEDIAQTAAEITAEREEQAKQDAAREAAIEAENDALREQAQRVIAVRDAWREADAALNPTQDTLRVMAEDTLPELFQSIRPGLDEPFAFLTQGVEQADLAFTDFLADARQFAGVDLQLTDEARDALNLQKALDGTTASLQKVIDKIGEHQQAISDYEGFGNLIKDVLGEAGSNLDNWNRKLALGQATQKEYNEAVKSGDAHGAFDNLNKLVQKGLVTQAQANEIQVRANELRKLSERGILREQAALALSIPALADFVAQHDDARTSYANLSREQQGFLAAVQDEQVQTALSTALMIKQLEVLGVVAEGTADKYITAFAAINPAFESFLDSVGLAQGFKDINVEAKAEFTRPIIDVAQEEVGEGITVPVTPVEQATVRRGQEDQREVAIPDTAEQIAQETTKLNALYAQLQAEATTEGGQIGTSLTGSIVTQIQGTVASIAAAVLSVHAEFALEIPRAKITALDVGRAFIAGIAQALGNTAVVISALSGVNGPVTVLSRQHQDAFVAGTTVGKSYLLGVAAGAKDPALSANVAAAGRKTATTLHGATMDELDAHSPSGKGIEAGEAFVQGVAQGVDQNSDLVRHSGENLAQGLIDSAADLTFGGTATSEVTAMAKALRDMAASEDVIDFRQLEGFANVLDEMDDPTGRLQRASNAIRSMADAAKTDLLNVSSAGQDFSSNLTFAADQIAAFGGDKTPKNLVNMSLELRKLSESSDQLDANRLRAYANELRATGDVNLSKTATYLDSIAADVDERARRKAITDASELAAQQGQAAAGGYHQALRDELERLMGDVPEALVRLGNVPDEFRAQARDYLLAALNQDTQGMIDEYNRLKGILDPASLQKITAAGDELRRHGLPRNTQLLDDLTIGATAEATAQAEAAVARDRAAESGSTLTSQNDSLASSYDRVTDSANRASAAVGGVGTGGGGGGAAGDAELSEALTRWQKMSEDVKAVTADFIRANLRGDEEAIIAEFNRLSGQLDAHSLDLIAAAGRELRTKGVPKGFTLTPELDLVPAIDALVASMPQLRTAILDTFHGIESVANARQVQAMERFLAAFVTGQRRVGLEAWSEISQFMTEEGQHALFNLAVELRGSGVEAGRQVGAGLAQGTNETKPAVRLAGATLAEQIIASVNATLGMHSPSKVMGAAGENAATSFADRFVQGAMQSIRAIQMAAQAQGTAFREAFAQHVQPEDGSLIPTSFFDAGVSPAATTRDLRGKRKATDIATAGRGVSVNAPISLGDIKVDGFNGNPQELAREIKEQVWGEFVNGVGRVWTQIEGATS